jgi:phosphate-selective porin OprO/OprP
VRYSAPISARTIAAIWLTIVGAVVTLEQVQAAETVSAQAPDPPARATTFKLRGRIDTDAITTTQSAANEAIFGDLGDTVGVRRAWIGAEGDFLSGGRYVTIIDVASGNIVLRDVFVAVGDTQQFGEIRAGHSLEPFSFELSTPSFTFPFLECSVISVLDPARNFGVSLFRSRPTYSQNFAIGLFRAGSDVNDFQGGDGATVGLTGRLTTAPINEDDGARLLHLGLALSERVPENKVIIINQQSQSPLLDLGDTGTSPFLPQIIIPASFQQLINLQVVRVNGPFWTQAEWYGTWIDQRGGGPVFLHGFHADCGWFLTGEHRNYLSTGVFGPVRVNRPLICCHSTCDRPAGWGALELTARFAYLDFQDSDTPTGTAGQFVGIRLPESTFGVNWYLADHLRRMFNYSYALPDEPNTGTSVANIFAARLAVFW